MDERTILAIGFLGQIVFTSRFFLQWIMSEFKGESVVPIYFWYISIIGSILLFWYAFLQKDPVIMLGQGSGIVIYLRNLMLINKKNKKESVLVEESKKE